MPEEDQTPSCGQPTELRSGTTSPGGPMRLSMSDAPQDVSRVVLNDPQAMLYWTGRFDLSVEELTEAIDAVGDDVAAVAAYLNHPA